MDSVFYYLSKIIWFFISPDTLLLVLILASLLSLFINKIFMAKLLLLVSSIALLIFSILPVGEWLLYPLENRFTTNPELPEKIDGIIVLSGAEDAYLSSLWNQVELGSASERILSFMALGKKFPDAKLIFTGGTGSLTEQRFKAADVAKELFQQLEFDTSGIIFERESRNTYENVLYSKNLIPTTSGTNWILITTSWHMPRAVGIFCKQNWPAIPFPVDHQSRKNNLIRINFDLAGNIVTFKTAIKEWTGLLAYYLAGKTTSLLPSRCY